MPRVNVEEVRVRIDDCWDKDNGQYYSIEFGNREPRVPDVSKASYEDQCATFQELIRKNRNIDYSGELQSQIIDACLEIIKEQKKMGKKAKGRTCELIAQMTNIPINRIKDHIARKKRRGADPQKIMVNEEISEYNAICRSMKGISKNVAEFNWDSGNIDKSKAKEHAEQLIKKKKKMILE